MGKFSESFKVTQRLKQTNWENPEAKDYWVFWAKETLAKSSPFRDLDLGEDSDDVEVRIGDDNLNKDTNDES